jgi:hypothetical protein
MKTKKKLWAFAKNPVMERGVVIVDEMALHVKTNPPKQ